MRQYYSMPKQWALRICVFLLILFLLLNAGSIILLASMNGYSLTAEETQMFTFQYLTQSKSYDMMREWNQKSSYDVNEYNLSPDFRGKTHFKMRILSPDGEILYTNLPELSGEISANVIWEETGCTLSVYEHVKEGDEEYWYDYYVYTGDPANNSDIHLYTIEGYYGYDSLTFDIYDIAELFIYICHPLRYFLPIFLLAGILWLAVLWHHMSVHTGHRQYLPDHPRYRGEVVLSFFDRVPYDIYMAVLTVLFLLSAALLFPLYDLIELDMLYLGIWAFVGLLFAMIILLMAAYITTVARWKAGSLWKNTLVWRILCLIGKILRWIWLGISRPLGWMVRVLRAIPLFWQMALFAPVVLFGYGLFSMVCFSFDSFLSVFIWLIVTGFLILLILYAAYSFRILMQSGKALSEGNLRFKTDTRNLLFAFRSHGEHLNRIGEGMEIALNEKIKSERFKTELITNVSHDIKTPLTSIINYTDLLSKEPLDGTARDYTDVIIRHAARLKKLIEDLIEASKASTGNIAVTMEQLDICQIIRQSIGEYEERIKSRGLQLMLTIPEFPVYVMADGRLLWRVLDNLYSNVCKYALEGTRVYILIWSDGQTASISIKNVSRDMLAVAGDELTERFVQGDKSRASEGSGLGLNIAKSLVELQQGRFSITCDGDLFRCDIFFPTAE